MVNPIAFGMITLGVLLLILGVRWMGTRRRIAGIALAALGVAAAATPLLVSFALVR